MAIYAIPFGNKNTASSRLRIYNIGPHIKEYFIGPPGNDPIYKEPLEQIKKGDVLIIQKYPAIEALRNAKKIGAKVIYDIDDYYWDKPEYQTMIDEADLVTVDTYYKKRMLNDKATVIPDSLDWDGTKKEKYGDGKIIGWTGYGNNSQYLNGLEIDKDYTLRLVTSPDWFKYLPRLDVQSRPWSEAMADKYLAECDYGMYYLPERKFEQCKGMHKLLKNWAIGLPTYVSPMPDYVMAFAEAEVDGTDLIIKNKADWKKLKPVKFDEKCRKYALKYEAKEIAKLWEKLF